uniref:CGG triplet repeat-binding protein 1 n=1 Tax=Rhodnius prolixus TaxID=13249 RepID=T1HLB1_RHOPR
MPRTSASNKQLVAKYLRKFPAELFRSDGDILYCTACDKRVSCSQRSQVTQHIATGSHIENKNRKKERTSYQAFLTSPASSKSTLSTDLCRALVRADIPFHKLKNPHFKGFLETYIGGKKMPDESALRKNYLEDVYKDTLTKIREHIKDGPIWASIDETTDVEGIDFQETWLHVFKKESKFRRLEFRKRTSQRTLLAVAYRKTIVVPSSHSLLARKLRTRSTDRDSLEAEEDKHNSKDYTCLAGTSPTGERQHRAGLTS